jgi:hypothetical protein
VQQAVSALVLAGRRDRAKFFIGSELGVQEPGKAIMWLSFAMRGHGFGYAVGLECCEKPHEITHATSAALCSQLSYGLTRLRADYETLEVPGAVEKRYSCMLFGKDAKLLVYTKGLKSDVIEDVQAKLSMKQADNRVFWLLDDAL